MDLKALIGLGGIPLIQALVQLVRGMFPGLPERFLPGVALFWGIVFNVVLAYLLKLDYGTAVVVGVVAGLGAAKLYEYGAIREKAES